MNKKVEKIDKKAVEKKPELIKKESTFKKKKKIKRNITSGIAYVYSTFNNTIISIADESGNVVSWSSAGAKGFKGSRKSTPYAAQVAADSAAVKAIEVWRTNRHLSSARASEVVEFLVDSLDPSLLFLILIPTIPFRSSS